MRPKIDYSLYLVTDRALMRTSTLEEAVEKAIEGGATVIQLREKHACSLDFFKIAEGIKRITDAHRIPLIINDRVDIALAVDAAGVHIGQSDLPAEIIRPIIGKDKILGVSVSTPKEAVQAEECGADYLGVGAMFATGTKPDAGLVSMEELKKIRQGSRLPIVVIGGIHKDTVPLFSGMGIDGIAVVSAIISAENISAAAQELKKLIPPIQAVE